MGSRSIRSTPQGRWTIAALLLTAAALVAAPQQAAEGAREGLALCAGVLLPALFPFLVLSSLAVELGLAARLGRLLGWVTVPLFRVSGPGACALVLGCVGGCPVGARTAADLYREGQLSRSETMRLLAFCSNCGPAFILGAAGAGVFGDRRVGLLLCAVHLLSALCVGLLFRFYGREEPRSRPLAPPTVAAVRFSSALTAAAASAVQSALGICSFVVLFGSVRALLEHFGLIRLFASALAVLLGPLGLTEEWAECLLTGLLELSAGIASLSGGGPLPGRLILAALFLGWAGASVHCQVLSLLEGTDLRMTTYLTGKALHALLSAGLTALLLRWPLLSRALAPCLGGTAVEWSGALPSPLLPAAGAAFLPILLPGILLGAGMAKKRGGKRRKSVV